ncbi:hypothetical protein [Deinococcus pimensis]|uniref:hypothetical protein n=1 Tax=Deinococcus pimensis TaxID=309888 RepID=UPI000488D81A|nr:hypothetical protein [Deinococcus pimensis]
MQEGDELSFLVGSTDEAVTAAREAALIVRSALKAQEGDPEASRRDFDRAVGLLRAHGRDPLDWDVRERGVALRVAGVPVWTAGTRTAATFGVALALTLEHGGVFFGTGAPFEGALPTAVIPQLTSRERGVRVARYTRRRYGLHLEEALRVHLVPGEVARLQRGLLGVLRALSLEDPSCVTAIRTLEGLVR